MRAISFAEFGRMPELIDLPTPEPSARGVVLRVEATGLCRSDIHGWQGHDDGIALPHVPGHEVVGTIVAVGAELSRFHVGQRVTTPFVCACGRCTVCAAGDGQVCPNQTQPGFTHAGSFAEFVALHDADVNLIPVPDELDSGAAALLGCRFATAHRGLVHQARLAPGETVAVFGCGGVGLSAVMIAVALGARVTAIDVDPTALARATALGAAAAVNATGLSGEGVVDAVRASGAPQVTVEALGREETVRNAVRSLAPRGRHVQIGLFAGEPRFPMSDVIARELQVFGSHGMPAADYAGLLDLVVSGALAPQVLVTQRIRLDEVPAAMAAMAAGTAPAGVTIIEP